MSFLLSCPNCGPRDVNEFAYAGEVTSRPAERPSVRELATYVHFRRNVAGVQQEWWFHRFGCETWFRAERDTRTNAVLATEAAHAEPDGQAAPAEAAVPDVPAV